MKYSLGVDFWYHFVIKNSVLTMLIDNVVIYSLA